MHDPNAEPDLSPEVLAQLAAIEDLPPAQQIPILRRIRYMTVQAEIDHIPDVTDVVFRLLTPSGDAHEILLPLDARCEIALQLLKDLPREVKAEVVRQLTGGIVLP